MSSECRGAAHLPPRAAGGLRAKAANGSLALKKTPIDIKELFQCWRLIAGADIDR
ncbi:hypothetical protein HMPREF1619_03507 [Klebsiella pneumoniae 909957]|nr:hypothetical protein HMPREF1619_03507 [Klebsiella pneumoniae 909957]